MAFHGLRGRVSPIFRVLLWMMGGLILALGLLLLVTPTLDGPHSGLFRNEASAVSTIRVLITFQDEYSTLHPDSGFACELLFLKPIGQQKRPGDSLDFLTIGLRSGYKFSLTIAALTQMEPDHPTTNSLQFLSMGIKRECGLSALTNAE